MSNIKILFLLSVIFFGFALVLISALRLSFQAGVSGNGIVLAQEVVQEKIEQDIEATSGATTEEVKEKVDYYLAYPGILPDHPLYWLKMVRDRILLWLTNDPIQRFERLLLYADKRLGASEVLIKGNQPALGVTTATKAEKYLEQALAVFKELEKSGQATPELKDNFSKALLKHSETLEGLIEDVPDEAKAPLKKMLEIPKAGYEMVKDSQN